MSSSGAHTHAQHNANDLHRHRHSIGQIEDIASIKSRRLRIRPDRAGSIAVPDNNEESLLDLLDNEKSTLILSPSSTKESNGMNVVNAVRRQSQPCPQAIEAERHRPRPKPTISATPPPVPMRAPAVPKRTYIPPQSQQRSQIDCRNHSSTTVAGQPTLPKALPTTFVPSQSQYPPPIPPPTSRPPRIRNQNQSTATAIDDKHTNTTSAKNIKNPPAKPVAYASNNVNVTQVQARSVSTSVSASASASDTNTKQTVSDLQQLRNKIPPPPSRPPPNIPAPMTGSGISAGVGTGTGITTMTSKEYGSICSAPMPTSAKVANVPPPLCHVPAGSIQKSTSNNKISMRQDSSVSSDSFSQTSSPSYTTKTMETPLLPHMSSSGGRVLCNGKTPADKSGSRAAAVANVLARKRQSESEMKDMNGNGALTKSASTPASLQTIVRFHNGSNMSLHHRIIRDMRRPSSHYVSRIRLKFRLAQVVVNAIALLAIGGGLAAYFKAYPSAVQIVNNNVTVLPVSTHDGAGVNPAPGICLPVIVSFCQYHKVPYNFTVFPNYMGHFGQRDAQQELEVYDAVVDVRCYELAALFLCSVFVPKCGPTGQVVRPCQKLCSETKRRCGFFLDVFGLALPDYLECSLFPDSPDPDVCVGHHEVNEAEKRAQKPVCPTGFQCDVKRCIPRDWKCDGHVDCEDQSDEMNCDECSSKGMIHCGDNHCMAQEHLCDGKVDCPLAQDERNCMRLSDKNGDEGRGQLQVYLPEHKKFMPACVTPDWNQTTSPVYICNLLGYSSSNGSRLIGATDKNISPPIYNRQVTSNNKSKRNLMKELGSCKSKSYTTVDLTCTNYVCGKVRKSYAERAKLRIVGGTPSKPGDWPFLAALLGGPEEVFYCAGVLIADQWVLTASHCVGNHSDVTGWTIQLGITRRHAHSYFGQKMKVRRVVPHPMYNLGVAHDNDIALFQLASPVTFHEHLLPVCLPPDDKELRPGINCTVIGWGKKEDKDMSEYEPAVNEVEVPVLDRDLCNTWLENRDLNVTDGMICAGFKEGGKDACQGDSGGPLLCKDDTDRDRWFVGGIVSWGIKCAHPHLPGVYAYVPKYIRWIKQQMALYSD